MISTARKWWPTRRNCLAFEALAELAYVRVLRATVTFSRLSRLFGEPQAESPTQLEAVQQAMGKDVGVAISRAARVAPFRCNCLTQAISVLRMLRRRGISCTLYLGVTRSADISREAHAWVRCGACIIVGETELDRYDAVFKFANP